MPSHHKNTSDEVPAQGQTAERRHGSRDLVTKLVGERTEMLARFCQLAGLEQVQEGSRAKPTPVLLQEFCQLLVDYIAAGHFSLYERIVNGTERRRGIAGLADDLFPRIAKTTDVALEFNDKYDCGDHCDITVSFSEDLSRLGEELAARIECEDRLLRLMC